MRNWFRAATVFAVSSVTLAQTAMAQTINTITPATGGIEQVVNAIKQVINWMLVLAGVIAVAYLVYAGIQYITGGSKGAEAAKSQITSAVAGVIIIVLAYAIFNIANSLLGGS